MGRLVDDPDFIDLQELAAGAFEAIFSGGDETRSRFAKAAMWAQSYKGLRAMPDVMSSPPTITIGGTTSAIFGGFANGAVAVAANDPRISYGLDTPFLLNSAYRIANATMSNNSKTTGGLMRMRFLIDVDEFELCTGALDNVNINIFIEEDGVRKMAYTANPVFFPAYTNTVRYNKISLGSPTTTFSLLSDNINYAAGVGSGYAVGDQITLAGGTFTTAAVIVVVETGSGGSFVRGKMKVGGTYTAINPTNFTQGSTTGSGTGFTLPNAYFTFGATCPQRKLRGIEIWIQGTLEIYGLVLASSKGVLLPWPIPQALPRLLIVGDSQTYGAYLRHGADHMASRIAMRLGLADTFGISANGGTGWNTDNMTFLRWSDSRRIADIVALNPDVVLFIGSQNDTTGASLTAAVTATINAVAAGLPNALIVGVGQVAGTGNNTAIKAGWEASNVYGKRALYIDNVTSPNQWITGTGNALSPGNNGNRDVLIASDGIHLGNQGREYFADLVALNVVEAVKQLVAA